MATAGKGVSPFVAFEASRYCHILTYRILSSQGSPKTPCFPSRIAEFANRGLVPNATDYLLDETDPIAVRGKQITLRPHDKVKLTKQHCR